MIGLGSFDLSKNTASGAYNSQLAQTVTATAMQPWKAALSNRDNATAHVMIIGDSISYGNGASAWAKTYGRRLAPLLNKKAPLLIGAQPVGGRGFIPATRSQQGAPLGAEGITTTGTAQGGTFLGVNLEDVFFNAPNQNYVIPLTGTHAIVSFAASAGPGVISYKVDAGAAVNIDDTTYAANYGQVTALIPLGAAGAHTLTLTWVSGTFYLNGIVEFNGDQASGIVVHNASLGGQDAYWYNGTQLGGRGIATFSFAAAMGVSCIIAPFGINAANAVNRTPAQFQGDLITLLQFIRSTYGFIAPATALPTVVFVPEYQPGTITTGYPWQQYIQAMYSAAMTDANCCVGPDLNMRLPTANGVAPWFFDNYHPLDVGHSYIAETIANFLVAE